MLELLMTMATKWSSSDTGPLPSPPSSNNWDSTATLCASQDKASIYMAGGNTKTGSRNDLVLRYNINSRTYTTLPNLPSHIVPSNYCQMWQIDNKLYVSRSKNWAVLNLATNTWSTIPTPANIANCPDYAGRTFIYKGRLLIFGLTPGYKSVLSEYLPGTNTIVLLSTMPTSLLTSYPKVTLMDDTLYVAENKILYEYDIIKNLWKTDKTYSVQFDIPAMVNYNKILYLMGTGPSPYVGVTTYDTLTDTYGTAPNITTTTPGATIVAAIDALAYILSMGSFSQYKLGD